MIKIMDGKSPKRNAYHGGFLAENREIFKERSKNHLFKRKMILYGILMFLWMVVIFIYSAQNAVESSHSSSGLTYFMVDILLKAGILSSADYNSLNFIQLEGFIRTAGDFTEYLIYGMLAFQLSRYSIAEKSIEKVLYPFAFCALYAITDEIHQYFVPGRAMQIEDLLVDFSGLLFGIAMLFFIAARVKKKNWVQKAPRSV